MQRHRQTLESILAGLSRLESDWQDDFSARVVFLLAALPKQRSFDRSEVSAHFLDKDFDAGLTALRLILDMSKDEFEAVFRELRGTAGIGITAYRTDPDAYVADLDSLGLTEMLSELATRPVRWTDLLVERLKSGRGSAVRGQLRGRNLENFTEETVKEVFGADRYDVRCQFLGAAGQSTEKADFAIPDKDDPYILIEVKGYGATGSKQTDIIGDFRRIIAEKRNDTYLLLVTDGLTWKARSGDLRRLVEMQNRGEIAKIYTKSMREELVADLRQLKSSLGI